MSIRSTVKALIIDNGKLLLNKCHDNKNGDYYSMPGGGQNKYEPLHDAVVRECLEETGYSVKPHTLVAICEEICENLFYREKYPQYSHKVYHIFLCDVCDEKICTPTEIDDLQVSTEWIDINYIKSIKILPKAVGDNIEMILNSKTACFLGTEHIPFNHG